ncbi:MAG: hypothetical protein ABI461_18075 [Polyangiaceae bacterium]
MTDSREAIDIGNLVVVDRAVMQARQANEVWERRKTANPERAADADPWRIHRKIAGKSVYDLLGARPAMAHETELVAALRAHVLALILNRVTFETEVALAEKTVEPLGIVDLGRPRLISWREAMRNVIGSPARFEAAAYLEALAECGPHVASAAREHRARRAEAAHRLGASNVHPGFSPGIAFAQSAARALLDATEDVARDAVRSVRKRAEMQYDRASAVDVIAIATAREAIYGWPSHLTSRWLEDLFAAHVHGLAIVPVLPPAVVGASSFARALEGFGYALGRAIAYASPPFVLADDACASGAHRVGVLFGGLVGTEIFHRRALDLGAEAAAKNARVLSRSLLIEARVRAAHILLGETETPSAALFEEVTFRVFGASLSKTLIGAWPLPRNDEPARFTATLEFPSISRSFVERFDEDWFRNPRAFDSLRRALPRLASATTDEAAAVEAARQFSRAMERSLA